MASTQAVIIRPFIAAVALGILLDASACGPLQQAKPDPLKFSSAQHFLRADRAEMLLDLERERQDARAGQNGPNGLPPCYNLIQNVNVEISAMDIFASGTVTSNIAAVQNDVTTMRAERADFERDINDFVNDGVPRPTFEPPTVTAITRRIEAAVENADATIMAIRADLSEAHSSAASLATGVCGSDTPKGAPPIPLVH